MRKIEKIEIVNFQIWENVSIDLNDFNIIKGSSNSGKSAIVRAINMVINNDWHKSWLRKDTTTSKVKLIFNDGTYIERIRGSVNSVLIKEVDKEEETWSGFGSNYPQEVIEFLNLGEENCSYQFDSHFFLSLSPTKRALTLGTFSDLQKIDGILVDVQKNIRDNDNHVKSLNMNLDNSKTELKKIQEILKAEKAVNILIEAQEFNFKLRAILELKEELGRIDLELDSFIGIDELSKVSIKQENLIEGMNYILNVDNVESEILKIDSQISILESKIKPEELCPTCGQLIGESHEKT